MEVYLIIISSLLFTFYLFYRLKTIYFWIGLWDYCLTPWRNHQNEQLRILAKPAQRETYEERSFGKCPGLIPAQLCPFPEMRQITLELQQNHHQIAAELDKLMAQGEKGRTIAEIDARLVESFGGDVSNWKTIWLQLMGDEVGNQEYLPTLRKLLLPFRSCLGLAFISILHPDTRIPPHSGVVKSVLRYHYGINVPTPEIDENGTEEVLDMSLNIDGHQIRWKNKHAFLFDDTYVHCAFNNTKKLRIILFLDFIRPMCFPLNHINHWINFALNHTEHFNQMKLKM
jgi:aspartyl/asparaginyl beta-hydroxylase (cupin superfamily)